MGNEAEETETNTSETSRIMRYSLHDIYTKPIVHQTDFWLPGFLHSIQIKVWIIKF